MAESLTRLFNNLMIDLQVSQVVARGFLFLAGSLQVGLREVAVGRLSLRQSGFGSHASHGRHGATTAATAATATASSTLSRSSLPCAALLDLQVWGLPRMGEKGCVTTMRGYMCTCAPTSTDVPTMRVRMAHTVTPMHTCRGLS